MNASQTNKLSMYLAVKAACDTPAHKALWQTLPAFAANYTIFTGTAAVISALGAAQKTTTPGVAANKAAITGLLLDELMVVAGRIGACASVTGDIELEAKVNFPRWQIAKLRDTEIDDRAQVVLDLANAHLAALADYGITAATLTALDGAIDAYSAIVESPRSATNKVKSITEAIADNFEKADKALEDVLDRLMRGFEKTAPDFFREYEAARIIVDRPGSHNEPPAPPATPA